MNRSIVATVAALILLLGLWRLLEEGPRGARTSTPEARAADASRSAPADVEVPPAPVELGGVMAAPIADRRPAAGTQPAAQVAEPAVEPPVVLAGLVIDGGGSGVPDATVTAMRRIADDSGGFGMRSIRYEALPELTTRTDAGGCFEVRGRAEGEVVVRAAKAGCVMRKEQELTLPAMKATLVLERAGTLEVTLATASRELAALVTVELRHRDQGDTQGGFDEGRAHFTPLLPGPWDVVLVASTGRSVLHVVPGVTVFRGETTRDARLQDLDLHQLLRRVRVTVVDSAGAPVQGAKVWVQLESGESGVPTGADGSVVLAAHVDGLDVAVRESGWCATRHVAVTEDLVVRLERSLTVRLVRPAGRAAELGDLYLHVTPVVAEGEVLDAGGNRDWTLSGRLDSVEVELDGPGVYRVQWGASLAIPGAGSVNVFPRSVTPQEFAVGAGTNEVILALDAAAVDDVLAHVAALATELTRQPNETDEEHARRVMQAALRSDGE